MNETGGGQPYRSVASLKLQRDIRSLRTVYEGLKTVEPKTGHHSRKILFPVGEMDFHLIDLRDRILDALLRFEASILEGAPSSTVEARRAEFLSSLDVLIDRTS